MARVATEMMSFMLVADTCLDVVSLWNSNNRFHCFVTGMSSLWCYIAYVGKSLRELNGIRNLGQLFC